MLALAKSQCTVEKGYVFYGAYHNEWRNKLLHIVFVPAIFTTTLSFLSRIQLTQSVDLSEVTASLYALSFVAIDPPAGIPYAAVIGMMQYVASHYLKPRWKLSLSIHLAGWAVQFVSHWLFERRAPALLDNLPQALHSSVFFVWLEVLFYFGYKPELKRQLDEQVGEMRAKLDAKKR